MTLGGLVRVVGWGDVERSLLQYYPDARESVEGYRRVFFELRDLTPVPNAMRLSIRTTSPLESDEQAFPDVVGRNGTLNRDQEDFQHLGQAYDSDYALAETEFALELHRWDEWLGMEIERGTLGTYGQSDIVAHCLWEMTFFGFEEDDIQAQRSELQRRVDELNAMTEDERKERLIPMEDVLKRMEASKDDDQ